MPWGGGAQPVKVTRLHIRYSKETFPEDLMFHQTEDTKNFQARYILRHPWKGSPNKCEEAKGYFRRLERRQNKSASQLAHLTGWDINDIRGKMEWKQNKDSSGNEKWWEDIWKEKGSSNQKQIKKDAKTKKRWWHSIWKK